MRLASWNTWKNDGDYRTRLAQMGAVLRALSADAVLLQECFRAEPDADTCAYLAAATGLTPIYAPARRKRRRFENSERDSESGLAVLTRWPLLDHDVIPLPSSDIGGERIALLVRVQTARGPLRLACVHLSHVRAEATLRRAQLEHVMARLADTARANETVLIGGDFNCARGDA
ncbi:MAG: endonuclease/exonuclease/phosphatase family protein, partial [Panacagrimonas sp.]